MLSGISEVAVDLLVSIGHGSSTFDYPPRAGKVPISVGWLRRMARLAVIRLSLRSRSPGSRHVSATCAMIRDRVKIRDLHHGLWPHEIRDLHHGLWPHEIRDLRVGL
jgi:hypothetical protein